MNIVTTTKGGGGGKKLEEYDEKFKCTCFEKQHDPKKV